VGRDIIKGLTRRKTVILLLAAGFALAGCAHKRRVRTLPPGSPVTARPGYTESGVASWYGHPYHGRPAANGEIYDMEKMTAAHRTLPFDTWVRVYDLDTQKSAEVRITDRGPFVRDRIIDLSRAAAREIEMLGPGTARVRIEVIRAPETAEAPLYAVQVGAFRNRENAERLRARMQTSFGSARLVERSGNPPFWRVLVGTESTQEGAAVLAKRIRENSNENLALFVVRIDTRRNPD
jgi:rare lipoprotein A